MAANTTVSDETNNKRPERRSRFSTPVDEEAMEFINAIEAFKAEKGRSFPSWTEVLGVLKGLGYRKVEDSDED